MERLNLWLILSVFAAGLTFAGPVSANVLFKTGDILSVRDVTSGQSAYSTSISAKPLDEVEFKVLIENVGTTKSPDVSVRVGFPLDTDTTLKNNIFVGVWSAPEARGSVNINVENDTPQRLIYLPGTAVKYGGGCNGCGVSDNIARVQGAYIGPVDPGQSVEVRFKAQLTDKGVASVYSASGITPTPAPTPVTSQGEASSAAVAQSTPQTGFGESLWIRTLLWLGVGAAGIWLRQLAGKMSRIEV